VVLPDLTAKRSRVLVELMSTFADLHRGDRPLLLPNAWDVPSALAFAAEGYAAVATTSFGVALGTGRPDGARASRAANLTLAHALASSGAPFFLSVDVEDGYSDDPAEVAAYVSELPAAGVNLEDSTAGRLIEPATHAAKVAAVKQHTPAIFVNARVDTYWLQQRATLDETLHRARLYIEAGADGIFVPGASDPGTVRHLAEAIEVPLNVLPVPGLTLAQLGELGVRRVSTGSLPYRAAVRAALSAAAAVRDGTPAPPAVPYATLQALFTPDGGPRPRERPSRS
jgi:2-methylisocitrate lyase-like PEP mutase family enzyme